MAPEVELKKMSMYVEKIFLGKKIESYLILSEIDL